MYQVMQPVIVTDEGLETFGQAGTVVNPDEDGKVVVKMDADGEHLAFEKTAIRSL